MAAVINTSTSILISVPNASFEAPIELVLTSGLVWYINLTARKASMELRRAIMSESVVNSRIIRRSLILYSEPILSRKMSLMVLAGRCR